MTIRTQFRILVAGIAIIPFLTLTAQFLLNRAREYEARYPVPEYEEISRYAGAGLEKDDWDRLADFIRRRRPGSELTVLMKDGTVIYATAADDAVPGTVLSGDILFGRIRSNLDRYVYLFDAPPRSKDLLIIMRMDRQQQKPPNPYVRLFTSLLTILGVLFAFSSAMSVFIARSITRSVTILEEATRRISAGELDLAVNVRGNNEITSLTSSLNKMRLTLKEDENRRSRFIMGVTHDLKTPLALIKGYAEAIADGVADDQASRLKSIGIIGAKVDQLEGMIDDLMEFVRMDTGEWRRALAPVNLRNFCVDFAKRLESDAGLLGRGADCLIDLPPELAVSMDERLATRALENLANNALRYTGEGGRIGMRAYLASGKAVVEIRDDGQGIGDDDLPRIFDPFYRGSLSRREQGMGLGLSVVKSVADSHGWELEVESVLGSGSIFRIKISF